jgi:hypothetical protein
VRKPRVKLALAVATVAALGVGTAAVAGGGSRIDETLTGYEEVPALSTPGVGQFEARISRASEEIRYRLSFRGLETAATQAHIHFENRTNAGPIVVFLCSNLGNGPAGTQPCPPAGGTVTGTIRPADVGPGATAQGLAPGEFAELVRAIRAGATYVNVHSTGRPSGEIRAQLEGDEGERGQGGHDGHGGHAH